MTPPVNGALTGSHFYQDVASFTCDSGYYLDGNSAITCQADATWSGTVPICPRMHSWRIINRGLIIICLSISKPNEIVIFFVKDSTKIIIFSIYNSRAMPDFDSSYKRRNDGIPFLSRRGRFHVRFWILP